MMKGSKWGSIPDTSFCSKMLPAGRSDKCLAAVIETGFSESQNQLDDDTRRWLGISEGDVQTAIAIAWDGFWLPSWLVRTRSRLHIKPNGNQPDVLMAMFLTAVRIRNVMCSLLDMEQLRSIAFEERQT